MTTSQARARLFQFVEAADMSHKPVQIKGRRASAVLVSSEADAWQVCAEGRKDYVTTDGIRVCPAARLLGTLV